MFRIPADTFQLFVASGVVNARFGTLMSAVHTLAMALLGTCAVIGVLRIDRRKLRAVLRHHGGAHLRRRRRHAAAVRRGPDSPVRQGQGPGRHAGAEEAVAGHGVQARGPGAAVAGPRRRRCSIVSGPGRPCASRYVPDSLPYVVLQHARRPGWLRRGDGATARPGSGRRAGVRAHRASGDRGQHRPGGVRPGDDGRGGRRRSRDAVSLLDALPG